MADANRENLCVRSNNCLKMYMEIKIKKRNRLTNNFEIRLSYYDINMKWNETTNTRQRYPSNNMYNLQMS